MVRELREFVDVALDTADERFQLRQHLIDVRGNLRHGPGEDVEVVVTVHLELAELFEEAFFTGSGAGQKPLPLGIHPGRADLRADAVELVLFLKFVDLAVQALLRKTECVDQLFQFGDAANHFRAVDDQFADGVHHAVEPRQRDAHRLGARSRFGGRGGRGFGRSLFRFCRGMC